MQDGSTPFGKYLVVNAAIKRNKDALRANNGARAFGQVWEIAKEVLGFVARVGNRRSEILYFLGKFLDAVLVQKLQNGGGRLSTYCRIHSFQVGAFQFPGLFPQALQHARVRIHDGADTVSSRAEIFLCGL
jgi:hypothetical protein